MSRTRMMGAGMAGASRKIALNAPTIGDKGQGLPSTIGRQSNINYGRIYGNNRNVIFRVCQVSGGVGRLASRTC